MNPNVFVVDEHDEQPPAPKIDVKALQESLFGTLMQQLSSFPDEDERDELVSELDALKRSNLEIQRTNAELQKSNGEIHERLKLSLKLIGDAIDKMSKLDEYNKSLEEQFHYKEKEMNKKYQNILNRIENLEKGVDDHLYRSSKTLFYAVCVLIVAIVYNSFM